MIRKFYLRTGTWSRKCKMLMLMALCAITAQAYTTISDVVIGNFKYNIYQATAAGEVTHAGCSGLSSAGASLTDVTIPGYVTYNGQRLRVQDVGYAAFMGNTNIKVVRLGYGIEGVSLSSFEGCTSLYRVYLPSSMKSVYKQSFYGCTNLTYVMFAGDTPPTLGDIAFYNTPSTKYVSCATYRGMNAMKADERWSSHFSNIGYHLGYYACDFSRTPNGTTHYYVIRNGIPYSNSGPNRSSCLLVGASVSTGTANIRLEQNVSTIDNNDPGSYHFYGVPDSAFMNTSHIGTIEDNSTFADKIGIRAFYNCTNLTSAQLRVDSIESYAFYNCTNLASVDFYNSQLGQGLRRLGGYAFGQTALTTVTIPKTTIQTMGYAPFYNCQSLKSITVDEANTAYCSYNDCLYNKSKTWLYQIPGAVVNNSNQADFIPTTLTRVLMFAGYGNTTLTNLNLSYGVTTIDDQAFSLMSKLSTVRLPSSLTSIGQYAFRTSPVTQIYCAADNPPSFTFGGFTDAQLSNIKLTVPYGRWSAYKSNAYWGKLNINYDNGSWCLAYDFLNQGTGYRVINSSEAAVVYIKDGNNGIYPTITVGNKTFDVTEIGNWASYHTRVGVSITNGYTIKRIKPRAFYNCELSNFTFSNIEEIGDSAFMNTTQLKVNVGYDPLATTKLKSIKPHAFDGSNLTAFKGYAPLTYIGHDAFARTTNMTTVDLSACTSLQYIYDYAFAQRSADVNTSGPGAAHETVKLPNSVTSIGYYAFYNNVLSTFNFPANLKYLRKSALQRSGISGVVELPYGITTLEEDCLTASNITRIVLPASVTAVHSRFFNVSSYDNPKLNAVVINTSSPLAFTNDNEDINYDYQRATGIANATIYVPVSKVNTWKADNHWKFGFNIVEGSYDFTGVTGDKFTVTSFVPSGTGTCRIVYNPETYNSHTSLVLNMAYDKYQRNYYITEIGEKCFYNATNLNTIYLGDKVRVIGPYAFAGSNLSKINNEEALNGETPVSNGFIRTSVVSIGSYAFNNCKNLHELFLPHISGRNTLSVGSYFFGNNASDFKCWVDYRCLGDYVGSTTWDQNKVYPHLLLDSEWQSFACVKPINFQGTNVEAYTVSNYSQSEKKATLSNVTTLAAINGGVVHGNANGTYYRLNYGSGGTTSAWLEGVTASAQTVNSSSELSYFKINATKPQFDKITTNTTFGRGYAYLKLNTSITGGATTITTNLSGDTGLKGDVNGDGRVNVSDVSALINMILGITAMDQTRADINGDNRVNVSDVSALINLILGIG